MSYYGHRDWTTFFVIFAVIAIVSWAIWYSDKHPCIKWEKSTCSSSYCAMYLSSPNGTQTCTMWQTRNYPCDVCVERKP